MLDLYCGEGGAGKGYADAGMKPYGVDNDPERLRNYPFPSHCGDVIEVCQILANGGKVAFVHPDGRVEFLGLSDFVFAHASPTCTGYSRGTAAIIDRLARYDRLIGVTREALIMLGLPYIIENVYDARREMIDPVMLCGRQFDLKATDTDGTPLVLDRHRLFESNVPLIVPPHGPMRHGDMPFVQVAGSYGGARRDKDEARYVRKGGYVPKSVDVQRELLGTPWMTEKGCWLSIPPKFTEYLGRQIIAHLTTDGR